MTNPISDFEESGCILVTGSNTSVGHPVIANRIRRAARDRGTKLIVINPKYIDLCHYADVWLQNRPGTDVPLTNAMANVILEEGMWDEQYVFERTEGFDNWRDAIKDYTPEVAEKITGVPADDIRAAARLYARPPSGRSAIAYTLGITLHRHGTDNVWALSNLALLTGNIGVVGGGVNPLRGHNNVQGACDMGCLPNVYPAYQQVGDPSNRAKFEAAWGMPMPEKPGLTEPEIMAAAGCGGIKALFILGENPAVSDPDSNHAIAELKALDFLVVQEIFLTETAQLAHVVLPGTTFAEKHGTFTSTERRVQRVRAAIPPVGNSRPDWDIVSEIARRVLAKQGRSAAPFEFNSPAEVMAEVNAVTPSYGGITYERLESSGGLQWPCPTTEHPGTPRLHIGKFTRGLGKFQPVHYIPPAEMPDEEYPLTLTTGRLLYHFHTGTMTRRVRGLNQIAPEATVEMNPKDVVKLGLADGEMARIVSRRGKVVARVNTTDSLAPGVVFMNFHFSESLTNALTSPALDPIAKAPELKVCAVRVEKV